MSYIITTKAKKDLDDLWHYIAEDKISAANKVENDILEAFDLIASTPNIGRLRPELLDKPLRFWVIHSYYIIYNPEVSPLQILRVISSFRDLKNTFAP